MVNAEWRRRGARCYTQNLGRNETSSRLYSARMSWNYPPPGWLVFLHFCWSCTWNHPEFVQWLCLKHAMKLGAQNKQTITKKAFCLWICLSIVTALQRHLQDKDNRVHSGSSAKQETTSGKDLQHSALIVSFPILFCNDTNRNRTFKGNNPVVGWLFRNGKNENDPRLFSYVRSQC